MSIKTTHLVRRADALKLIERAIYERDTPISNEQIEDILEAAIHNGFYNFVIVNDEDFEKNKTSEFSSPYMEGNDILPDYNDAY